MTAFNVIQWCDFIRGVAEPEQELEMQRVLDAGDVAALRTVARLQRVAEVARADREAPVPDTAVRMAKAIAGISRRAAHAAEPTSSKAPTQPTPTLTEALGALLRFLVPDIDFDSFRDPLPAGTRDLQPSHRQLVARAESFTVDVRLEHESEPPSAVVVGQVLDGPKPLVEAPVFVLDAGRIVGHSLTNRFGEFQLEGLPETLSALSLLVDEGVCLEIPLADRTPPDFSERS